MPDKPNFAMLIGTKKPSGAEGTDHAKDLGQGDDMGKEEAEKSAVHDMFAALKSGDEEGFGSALHDYLEICFPELGSDDDESMESGDESEPSDSESY